MTFWHQTILEQVEKLQELIEVNSMVVRNQEEYQRKYDALVNEYEITKAEHKKVELEISNKLAKKETIKLFVSMIKKARNIIN